VSCLTNEGFSTVEIHRCLHLTKATVQYLAENFVHLKRIAGIESWTRDCTREALNSLLNSDRLSGRFSIISL
jgi:predicted transcriptional regulator